jgi:hypothetical protein
MHLHLDHGHSPACHSIEQTLFHHRISPFTSIKPIHHHQLCHDPLHTPLRRLRPTCRKPYGSSPLPLFVVMLQRLGDQTAPAETNRRSSCSPHHIRLPENQASGCFRGPETPRETAVTLSRIRLATYSNGHHLGRRIQPAMASTNKSHCGQGYWPSCLATDAQIGTSHATSLSKSRLTSKLM